ncbi:hypothetical protein CMK13_14240 [Candidatus Poribacteria bacterium]|nr:hypothetical protein [Candidatus Poribacteria bacterium]OUT58012.1 MAG: hypothetical protein CBB75_13600 [bacterium TMED15]
MFNARFVRNLVNEFMSILDPFHKEKSYHLFLIFFGISITKIITLCSLEMMAELKVENKYLQKRSFIKLKLEVIPEYIKWQY